MRYADGQTDVISAGDAYDIRPGHNAHVDDDAEFVEFTLADKTPGINTVRSRGSPAARARGQRLWASR